MKIVDQALAVLQKFRPSLTLKSFLQKIQPIVEQYRNLSPEEINVKVLEYIENEQPFGKKIAQGAKSALGDVRVSQESKQQVRNLIDEGALGEAKEDWEKFLNSLEREEREREEREREVDFPTGVTQTDTDETQGETLLE